jgi:hypothetical protein
MLPMILMGSMIGALGSIMLPNLVLQILLTILLVTLAILTGMKGRIIYQRENIRLQALERARAVNNNSGEDIDEEQFHLFMNQSQPSIFEIVLEDLLILKVQQQKMDIMNKSMRARGGGGDAIGENFTP